MNKPANRRRSLDLSLSQSVETLESRRLLTVPTLSSWNLVSNADGGYTGVPSSGPVNGETYSIRALVEYYNNVYNGEANQPFVIELGNGTYTLSESANTSSDWGGRLDNGNQFGDLDINPSHTFAPLIIQGPAGGTATLTCSKVTGTYMVGGSNTMTVPLDRLIHVISGSVSLQNLKLTGGLAWENGSGSQATDSLGGAVLVNPGGTLSLTNCRVSSNAASATLSTHAGSAGLNAAGGGIYGSAGSVISINGTTDFNGNRAIAGKGGISRTDVGLAGGNAFGAGLAIAADVSEPAPYSSSEMIPATELNLNAGPVAGPGFRNNRLNSYVAGGQTHDSGGSGGAGSNTGGAGGNAFGAGLYMGSGQLNIDGGAAQSPIQFQGNQARGGTGYSTRTTEHAGANGIAQGAGVFISPGQLSVANGTASIGILQFNDNTAGASSSSIDFPVLDNKDKGYTTANGSWSLRTAVAALSPLVSTGMNLTLNLPAGEISLVSSPLGNNTGSISISNTAYGRLNIVGDSTVINGAGLNGSIFTFGDSTVSMSNLTITGANASLTNGGGVSSVNSTVTLSNIIISNNTLADGSGAGINQSGGWLFLNDSIISQNSVANGSGGGVFASGAMVLISNSILANNTASGGGGLSVEGGSLQLSNATLIYNTSVNQPGGGIADTQGSLTINNSNISLNNSANSGGGGIYIVGSGYLNVNGGVISMNHSKANGAGIWISDAHATLVNAKINHNSAGGDGGGLCATSASSLNLTQVSISNNSAPNSNGGGIYASGGTLNVKNNSIIQYNSASQGGGAYLTGSQDYFNGTVVKGNTANLNGGGLLSSDNTIHLTNASVVSNEGTAASGSAGGGIYQNAGGWLYLAGTIVQKNSAANGGGILCDNSLVNGTASKIIGNKAIVSGAGFGSYVNANVVNFSNVTLSENEITNAKSVAQGGGLYLTNGTLNASGFKVLNNKISTVGNDAIEGAGIYAVGTTINFNGLATETTIQGNELVGPVAYGAGIYAGAGVALNNASELTLTNNVISDAPGGVGGAIAFGANSSFTSSGTITLDGNIAPAGGDDFAFQVNYTSDNNNNSGATGPGGINYFTNSGGSGSLRDAIAYCQNWMQADSNLNSMAIMLTNSASNYLYSQALGQITTSVPGGNELTIIGTNGNATIEGAQCRVLNVSNSGSLVLQNLNIVGGYATTSGYGGRGFAAGGGIFQNGGTLTLNGVNIGLPGQMNQAVATLSGSPGWNGTNATSQYDGYNGGSGSPGASAYGGGFYLADGVLNFMSNSSISNNSAIGAVGGAGGNGGNAYANEHFSDLESHWTLANGGNGGAGGNGGSASGGGIYQAGGTINFQSVTYDGVSSNVATPGNGGQGGQGGSSASASSWIGISKSASGGSNGPNGSTGAASPNYQFAGGSQVYSSSAAATSQSFISAANSPKYNPAVKMLMELHAADGKLIASAYTDSRGHYHFDTDFTGMAYVQAVLPSTHKIAASGTSPEAGRSSAFDSATGRSPMAQFISGESVNRHLDLVLNELSTELAIGKNSVGLVDSATHAVLWNDMLMPAGYKAGFTVSPFDLNGDSTLDYVVMPKGGPSRVMVLDGRTGAVTNLAGSVNPGLRKGVKILTADLVGDSTQDLVLTRVNHKSGFISVVDIHAGRVAWTSKQTVVGGMDVSFQIKNQNPNSSETNVVLTSLKRHQFRYQKTLSGKTGKLLDVAGKRPRLK